MLIGLIVGAVVLCSLCAAVIFIAYRIRSKRKESDFRREKRDLEQQHVEMALFRQTSVKEGTISEEVKTKFERMLTDFQFQLVDAICQCTPFGQIGKQRRIYVN